MRLFVLLLFAIAAFHSSASAATDKSSERADVRAKRPPPDTASLPFQPIEL
jgi:hypothetical protein